MPASIPIQMDSDIRLKQLLISQEKKRNDWSFQAPLQWALSAQSKAEILPLWKSKVLLASEIARFQTRLHFPDNWQEFINYCFLQESSKNFKHKSEVRVQKYILNNYFIIKEILNHHQLFLNQFHNRMRVSTYSWTRITFAKEICLQMWLLKSNCFLQSWEDGTTRSIRNWRQELYFPLNYIKFWTKTVEATAWWWSCNC